MELWSDILGRVLVVIALLALAYAAVVYVLTAKSLQMIARRRGIPNPWLAWVPVANSWLLGSISDQYKMRKYGYDPELRKTLLILSVVSQGGSILLNSFNLHKNAIHQGSHSFALLWLLLIVALAVVGGAIAQAVYNFKARYDLYASCKPNVAVLFLVLSIVTPAGPFLLYACCDSDEGMSAQTEI